MGRVAVFVDTGYLYAQDNAVLNGSKLPRTSVTSDASFIVDKLKALSLLKDPDCKLLSIYWYDSAIGGNRPHPIKQP